MLIQLLIFLCPFSTRLPNCIYDLTFNDNHPDTPFNPFNNSNHTVAPFTPPTPFTSLLLADATFCPTNFPQW